MGQSAGRRVDRWRFWVLRFRLMVERGPHSRPQASEGEAQHGPFCWTGRISQGNKYLHRGRHGQDRAGSEGGKRAGSSSAGADEPRLSLQTDWIGSGLLTHRKLRQSKAIAIDNDLRGTLRNFGLKVGMVGKVKFEARIKELVENIP